MAIQMKRTCSNEEKLSSQLKDLKHWIQNVHSMNRENLLKKREKQDTNDTIHH